MPYRCAIEITAAGILATDDRGRDVASPACAVVSMDGKRETLLLGYEALAQSRLNPRQTYTRFWDKLDQQKLARPAASATTQAEIAWFHLQSVWQTLLTQAGKSPDEVILAIPEGFGHARIALLLGIAQSCDIPVVGLAELAVAATSIVQGLEPDSAVYLDAAPHHLSATSLSTGEALLFDNSRVLLKQGLADIYDQWADQISKQFLKESRFDPMHRASSEQALYQQLPKWLDALQTQPVVSAELQAGSRVHHIELSRDDFLDTARPLYRAILDAVAEHASASLLLSHRLSVLPELPDLLARSLDDINLIQLPANAAGQAVIRHFETIRSDAQAPAFVTRLPLSTEAASRSEMAEGDGRSLTQATAITHVPITHVLSQGVARPVQSTLPLDGAGSDLQVNLSRNAQGMISINPADACPMHVNGQSISKPTALHVDDVLELKPADGQLVTLRMIHVQD